VPRLRVLLAFVSLPGLACAQTSQSNRPAVDDKGTYLGILFNSAPMPTDTTVRTASAVVQVSHVLPNSPADRAGLRRNDVVLEYDGEKVRNCEHLAGLIRDDKPERTVKLALERDGRRLTLEATLELGPALVLPGTAKTAPAGPITVAAKPLPDGKMRVTVQYLGAKGKAESLVCEGSTGTIDEALQKLPERERDLVRKALERIRMLNTEGPPAKADDKKR
jgi:membrane-associated protease RseP (regulator of RpoE activity)